MENLETRRAVADIDLKEAQIAEAYAMARKADADRELTSLQIFWYPVTIGIALLGAGAGLMLLTLRLFGLI